MKKIGPAYIVYFIYLTLAACGGGGGGGGNVTIDDVVLGDTTTEPELSAKAGPDQNVSSGSVVTLNASDSTVEEGKQISYQWVFSSVPNGSNATFSDSTVVNPTFLVNVPGQYTISLIVNNGTVDSSPDVLVITAADGNSAPVADAGDNQFVVTSSTVNLDGSASSDADSDALSFSWKMTSVPTGSTAALAGAGQVSPVFTPDIDGAYVIQLVVNDGLLDSAINAVTITASSGNVQPVANAGEDQSVVTGNLVMLDGNSSSDANTLDVLSYTWAFSSVPFGSTATLADSQTVAPTFLPNIDGAYVITLQVNDGSVDSLVDSVTVITFQNNNQPVADAGGDRSVSTGSVVLLNGSGSTDTDGDSLTYSWTMVDKPLGSVTTLLDSQLKNASFTPDLGGDYIVSLRVFDGKEFSAPVNVTIEVIDSVGDASGVFSTGFENGLGLWSADNGIWDVGEPTSGPNSAYLDKNVAATILDGDYPDITDSRLVSPSIVLPTITGFDEIHLRFWQWFSFAHQSSGGLDERDEGWVQVSENLSAGVFGPWVTLMTFQDDSGDWSKSSADLSAYAGKKIRIGFLLNNNVTSYINFIPISSGWYIDEILVEVISP